ncbi:MAG: hypothetical protein HYT20_02545, partial [Candidatus Nealsonbacteria bacterium]|nr:hypothetical protein [Candidatus Nealsonbacteria bacterium]
RKVDMLLDLEAILDKTEGFSGADIFEIIRRTLEAKVREEISGKIPDLVTADDILRTINSYEGRP